MINVFYSLNQTAKQIHYFGKGIDGTWFTNDDIISAYYFYEF
jgi:hypothetical protein